MSRQKHDRARVARAVGLEDRMMEPERLDSLPSLDARAIRARRDLRRVNACMGHARIIGALLAEHCAAPPHSIIDLGGGDGSLLLRLARRRSRQWPDVSATVVDRHDAIEDRTVDELRSLGWELRSVIGDAVRYLDGGGVSHTDVVIANLFLHHLDERQLRRLFARIAEVAGLFIACEPRRSALALAGCRMLWAIGCSDVSRHDAAVSVRAGFLGSELSALWPRRGDWTIEERPVAPFTHLFLARRRAAPVRE